ncbi:hypothetical protein PTE30175_04476 [Pandoraea terrae]|uniref:Lipoprotein n=1 Tax=Pandoraea terrae TaxID=1537710 RepID=A0A5E4YK11_9BURK|nr:DUF4810 domain-containing protein [Pandoraea terrae]VVE49069.1 hypothetical protein PTE30175_04476 [Pandoraea terrae]
MTSIQRHFLTLLLLCSALLAGCASSPKTLYQWEGYEPQVYEYFKGESTEAQISALEEDLQKIRASGNTPPPGYHAHLGLLYGSVGNDDQMTQQFQAEKALFPESSAYFDFLQKNFKK